MPGFGRAVMDDLPVENDKIRVTAQWYRLKTEGLFGQIVHDHAKRSVFVLPDRSR